MKTASLLGALLLCAACPASALAQSADDLKNDQQTRATCSFMGWATAASATAR